MDAYKSDLDCNKTINQYGVENHFLVGMNHTLTTTITGSKCTQKNPTIRLTYRVTMLCMPPKCPFFTASWTRLKSSPRLHTQQHTLTWKHGLRLVNQTENAQSYTFKAPCCCFENAPYTALTIVCTINVNIDCKKKEVSNLNQKKNILDCKSRQ